jgi:hypothetical protein
MALCFANPKIPHNSLDQILAAHVLATFLITPFNRVR